ncbi:MAG: thioether cross-link-forming SCIFF peptide maturase [Clostridia bacterium]
MIHKFYMLGVYIVLDVNSGSIYKIDKLAYEMLDLIDETTPVDCPLEVFESLQAYSKRDVETTYNELYELISSNQLFTEEIIIDNFEKYSKNLPLKAVCLNVAHSCNLKCDYCFASKGDYTTGKILMSLEVGKKAIDYCIENSGNRHNIEIDYFGGEPLLNFDVVKEITEYAKKQGEIHNKHFRFTITTNGVLLDDDKIKYINEEMSNVVLSLDGRKEVNDKIRKTYNDDSCFDTIVPKFQKLVKARGDKEYYVRGTFTKYNLDFTNDVLKMHELGFKHLSVEPAISNEKEDYSITSENIDEICLEYEKLLKILIDKKRNGEEINFFHFLIDIDGGPCAIKRTKGCGSGTEYICVTPEGNIYPCHQFVGKEEFIMGNVFEKKINSDIKNTFENANLINKDDCNDCFSKYYCSGGCNANNFNFNNDIKVPYELSCKLQRKRLECSLALKVLLQN